MGITVNEEQVLQMILQKLPHRVDLVLDTPFIEALDWCNQSMGQQFASLVSGGLTESPCYVIRDRARWTVWQGSFWFACRGDATYLKLKWGGRDHSE